VAIIVAGGFMATTLMQKSQDTTLHPDRAWQAVMARDQSLDGRVFYAVRSTGIYCRPSCPSRRPARKHVEFFALPGAAELAGYRPCRRCHPRDAGLREGEVERVMRACRELDSIGEGVSSLLELSQRVGTTPTNLRRLFKRVTGLTPRRYLEARRIADLKQNLRKGEGVSRALFSAGYGSTSRVYERSNAFLGMTPAAYGRGGRGMEIGYSVTDSPLGRLLVAATDRGICSVQFGDSTAALVRALGDEYPAAQIHEAGTALSRTVGLVLRRLEGKEPAAELPLDLRATAFQWAVWRELQRIPRGETRSYREVARAIGRPSAVRAVAQACASNRVAVVVPCHRVVRTDGGLGGYRWGLDRKKNLLKNELPA
jgi:AraC family transcriptional regulator of adaptative response/methylated-DNA-[protein]-cysteine methyltransferase